MDEPTNMLPVILHKEEIINAVNLNQVTIIVGNTGCGKTTQVPQIIYNHLKQNRDYCRIVVTQPRRIAAISVAKRVSREMGRELGAIVGYKIGNDAEVDEDTAIQYTTPGILVQTIVRTRRIRKFTHYIMDEVHERDLESEVLLILLRYILVKNRDNSTKIILMSATIDPTPFLKYFFAWSDGSMPLGKAALVQINSNPQPTSGGLQLLHYEIKEIYLDEVSTFFGNKFEVTGSFHGLLESPMIENGVYKTCISILQHLEMFDVNNKLGGVLVFLPGIYEIEKMYRLCEEEMLKNKHLKWTVLPLHSMLIKDEQMMALKPVKDRTRKIVLSTNIAESSLTVADVTYVIDFCLHKSTESNFNQTSLKLKWASKNQCKQRRGRVGRVSNGFVFRMVTEEFFNQLSDDATPEICNTTLDRAILLLKTFDRKTHNPSKYLALGVDKPYMSVIKSSMAKLKLFGALTLEFNGIPTIDDGYLTQLGKFMGSFPFDASNVKLIAFGIAFGVLEECVIIVAGTSEKNPFTRSFFNPNSTTGIKKRYAGTTMSDSLALVNLFRKWRNLYNQGILMSSELFLKKSGVTLFAMRQMEYIIKDIERRLERFNVKLNIERLEKQEMSVDEQLLLKLALAGAHYPNYFSRSKVYRGENGARVSYNSLVQCFRHRFIAIDKSSVNYLTEDEIENISDTSSYFIASSIGSGSTNEDIVVLRETTMLPDIPGILDLCGLIFCPELEFRVSTDEKRVTGYLAGLGSDQSGKPVYEGSDMEVTLNMELTKEDIRKINEVRLHLRYLFTNLTKHRTNFSLTFHEKFNHHECPKVLKIIKELLYTNRTPMTTILAKEPYAWSETKGRVGDGKLLLSSTTTPSTVPENRLFRYCY